MSLLKKIFILALLLCNPPLFAGPDDYYSVPINAAQNDFEAKLQRLLSQTHITGIDYKEARTELFGNLHLIKKGKSYSIKDVYCQKEFTSKNGVGPGKIPNYRELNCEHTWPQSKFNPNQSRRQQKTDLHHLYPTDSRSNSTRKNYPFARVNGESLKNCASSKYGKAMNENHLAFEPPAKHRGNIARSLFYFSVRYNIEIDDAEEVYLRKWHKSDPVDHAEKRRNNLIQNFQGNRNPFIDRPSWVYRIKNF